MSLGLWLGSGCSDTTSSTIQWCAFAECLQDISSAGRECRDALLLLQHSTSLRVHIILNPRLVLTVIFDAEEEEDKQWADAKEEEDKQRVVAHARQTKQLLDLVVSQQRCTPSIAINATAE